MLQVHRVARGGEGRLLDPLGGLPHITSEVPGFSLFPPPFPRSPFPSLLRSAAAKPSLSFYPSPFPLQLGRCQGGRGGSLPGGDPGPVHTQLLPKGVDISVNIASDDLHCTSLCGECMRGKT